MGKEMVNSEKQILALMQVASDMHAELYTL